jgi:hypothetical protein
VHPIRLSKICIGHPLPPKAQQIPTGLETHQQLLAARFDPPFGARTLYIPIEPFKISVLEKNFQEGCYHRRLKPEIRGHLNRLLPTFKERFRAQALTESRLRSLTRTLLVLPRRRRFCKRNCGRHNISRHLSKSNTTDSLLATAFTSIQTASAALLVSSTSG